MVLFENHPTFIKVKQHTDKYPELFYQTIPQHWKDVRTITDNQLDNILSSQLVSTSDYDNENLFVLGEYLHYINPSLAIKLGVNIILFGGALRFLGTNKHHPFLEHLVDGEMRGCFSMTEIAHGSDLKHLETTARKVGNKLIIHTENDQAVKCWIGGATTSDFTVVFCHLYDENNVHLGLHAVLVPLKNNPNVTIEDMGSKNGLNGIDNGYIRFNKVEVSTDNLLDKYGGFNTSGKYESKITDKDVRFSYMLSALSMGRISIAVGSYSIAYKAFIIALKYNLKRRQFLVDSSEKRIIEYQTQLHKMLMIYSRLYHIKLGILDLINVYIKDGFTKYIHAMSSLLKAYSSWNAVKITNLCREMCGGHGYLWSNQLGLLLNDVHVYQTFEGDNTVLVQQGVKWLLDDISDNSTATNIVEYLTPYNVFNNLYDKINSQYKHNIIKLAFKLNGEDKQKLWLDNLRSAVNIGIQYTELHLVNLNKNKNSNVYNIFTHLIYYKTIPKHLLQLTELEETEKKWDKTMSKLTNYIEITQYPNYKSKL